MTIIENYVLFLCNGREGVIKKGQLIWTSLSGSIFPRGFQSISLSIPGSFHKIFFLISIVMFTEATVFIQTEAFWIDFPPTHSSRRPFLVKTSGFTVSKVYKSLISSLSTFVVSWSCTCFHTRHFQS